MSEVIVVGAGFAGLAAAAHLAAGGAKVRVVERHEQPGGRARTWSKDGFMFDLGPSWYWMPDVFERYFERFGYRVDELYELRRLDPSYRVVWPGGDAWDIPAGLDALRELFEHHEPGAGEAFDEFIDQTSYIYREAFDDYLFRPSLSFFEFVDPRLVTELFRLKMVRSMSNYARSFFEHPRLARLVEWPVLFLGASAEKTSAMYSLMSYADMALGTWYPMGGMHRIIEAMVRVAEEQGVQFEFGRPVNQIVVEGGRARGVRTPEGTLRADAVLASADYHHVERDLLAAEHRQFGDKYWSKRTMSPSSLLFYLGLGGDLGELGHHTLFFDEDLDRHMDAVYERPRWPDAPLFYACAPSVTDPSVAPEGDSNLFLLIPLAAGLSDSETMRERLYHQVMQRLEDHVGQPLRERVVVKRSYAMEDFEQDYGAFKGNAYGMANTLRQTGPLKPPLRSKTVGGLYFAGQLTVPGPGMPPSLISGELSAKVLLDELRGR
ncbi:phytoene desaturase [Persicimonas caeni]|uniref:Phytoene desaturase n=1 Tax=Persicimonas caeni TaxID=2292766 RepID=A0A4Y6PVR4_PERCE|nr:phytoene desaturase family protein [Persicimonas caeni]QDG52209.1 phytoene desaturase [Persicimonas caeni]QED33431.1 phytoene desaturase [Persicimonas caeni]